jgi:hypothetical protein
MPQKKNGRYEVYGNPVPGILLFLSFVILRWYPLDGQEWLGIKAKLAEIHKEKERKYLESKGINLWTKFELKPRWADLMRDLYANHHLPCT